MQKTNSYRELLNSSADIEVPLETHLLELADFADDLVATLVRSETLGLTTLANFSASLDDNKEMDINEKYENLQNFLVSYYLERLKVITSSLENRHIDTALLHSALLPGDKKH